MKALMDTCVIIDALQNREPFAESARTIFLLCANRQCDGYLTAKAMTDIYYLTHRQTHSDQMTREILEKLTTLFGLLDTVADDIHNALIAQTGDFEDAVMIETAKREGMDCIVTRNTRDYAQSAVRIYTPDEFVEVMTTTEFEIFD